VRKKKKKSEHPQLLKTTLNVHTSRFFFITYISFFSRRRVKKERKQPFSFFVSFSARACVRACACFFFFFFVFHIKSEERIYNLHFVSIFRFGSPSQNTHFQKKRKLAQNCVSSSRETSHISSSSRYEAPPTTTSPPPPPTTTTTKRRRCSSAKRGGKAIRRERSVESFMR